MTDFINPNKNQLSRFKPKTLDAQSLLDQLKRGDRAALSQALTLVESKTEGHRKIADKLIQLALPFSGKSIRIGITGVPGVGKSTFIEAFGEHLTQAGKKLAVLAIDPTSTKNKGSILGDKTRMEKLSVNQNAFIRPSPSSGSLGGVAHKTREAILLCEAAGFDVIFVETVGVGQSETMVKSMVDFFMLLMLAGAGDELQGIKRGIMEMADLLVINKADGDNIIKSKAASAEYKRALHLFPPNENEWIPRVAVASALEKSGMDNIWKDILEFNNQQQLKGYFDKNRQAQQMDWFDNLLISRMTETFLKGQADLIQQIKLDIRNGQLNPSAGVSKVLEQISKA